MFQEYDVVRAIKDLPNTSGIGSTKIVPTGQRGTILIAYPPSADFPKGAYEIEFCNGLDTLAVMLVDGQDVELVQAHSSTA